MFAFVHIAKTAGTTLTSILRRSYGARHFDDRVLQRPMRAKDLRQLKRVLPFVTSLAGHGIRPHLDLHEVQPDLRYYTFLREPIERAVSCFQFVVATQSDYRDQEFNPSNLREWFLRHTEKDNNCQTWHLAGRCDAGYAIEMLEQRVGFIGLVSAFDESLRMLREWMNGALDIRYQSLNVSAKRGSGSPKSECPLNLKMAALREFCQSARREPALLDFLRAHNEADQALYEFAKGTVYPRQRQQWMPQSASPISMDGPWSNGRAFALESRLRLLPAKIQRNLVVKPLKRWLFDAA